MRSYHKHVKQLLSGPQEVLAKSPVFRSSAIFPALQEKDMSTRILFMGYWFLKRKIAEVTCVTTLRDSKGTMILRTSQVIRDARAFRIELADCLEQAQRPRDAKFEGSIEVEIHSAVDMVFPYPAMVVNYYGPQFSSMVHTAQRVFNDHDDMRENCEAQVPESGFNIYADADREPFFGLINGREEVPQAKMDMEFYNSDHEVLKHSLRLGDLKPYETRIIYPNRILPLEKFLKGKVGASKIDFRVKWIYPRLICGNLQKSLPAINITHSYYDCSQADEEGDYWFPPQEGWHPAALMVPISADGQRSTTAYFYPILSPSILEVDVEIYSPEGKCIGRKERVLRLESPMKELAAIPFKEICQDLGLKEQGPLAAKITARPVEGSKLPARIKLGLDRGLSPDGLPCNICTNLHPFNPAVDKKPRTFRWGPVLSDQGEAILCLTNSSQQKDYTREAIIQVEFHREQDSETLKRKVTLAPNGSVEIHLNKDQELLDFLGGHPGWYTAVSTTPYIGSYYFVEHLSGVVGGDHGF